MTSAGIGALIVLVVGLLWELLGAGAESKVASSPKVVELEAQIGELGEKFNTYQLETTSVHATQDEKLDNLAAGQNRMLDILIGD